MNLRLICILIETEGASGIPKFLFSIKIRGVMEQHIIISCTHEDKRYLSKIQKWATQGKLGGKVYVIPQDDDYFYFEDGSVDEDRMIWALKEASLVIVLIGENNLDHPWLEWEGEFCHQWGIRRVLATHSLHHRPDSRRIQIPPRNRLQPQCHRKGTEGAGKSFSY
jgi:hypothetical protein